MIEVHSINKSEALRYLGKGKNVQPTEQILGLVDICEQELLTAITPKFVYKKIDLPDNNIMSGKDIEAHLQGCECAILMCATLGNNVDKLIRLNSVNAIDKALIIDALASACIEQVCDKVEEIIKTEYSEYNLTWRFSCGYGDYPLEMQSAFINLLDAPRKIGLCTNQNYTLEPTKSVTAIIGLSKNAIPKHRHSCLTCNMADTCKYRKGGLHCVF